MYMLENFFLIFNMVMKNIGNFSFDNIMEGKRKQEENRKKINEKKGRTRSKLFGNNAFKQIGGAFSALTYIYADKIIFLTAPGAEGENAYLALSPSITSIAVISSCVVYILMKGSSSSSMNSPLLGVFISSGASVGSLMQWIMQVMIHKNSESETKFISWKDFFSDKDVHKLKLMTPCILVSCSVAVGFGCLTAEGENAYLALSPSITSIAVISSCVVYILMKGSSSSSMNSPLLGVFISSGASVGSLMQWIMQVMIHKNSESETKFISWKDFFSDKDVHKLFALMLPATLSSGLVQITSLTDLYFSSFIPGAAAGLSFESIALALTK
ncbi:hypothetical protein COCNU_02G013790 [Cocos nucifera]|uniref:Uncharacterized protein n=1 Tax=Cocos nucifera TaxID=13894 RepID=A0A8K0HZW6_COCNU|nr:hypothetical protein COCNU_02G013790 [Cocos nucifera]